MHIGILVCGLHFLKQNCGFSIAKPTSQLHALQPFLKIVVNNPSKQNKPSMLQSRLQSTGPCLRISSCREQHDPCFYTVYIHCHIYSKIYLSFRKCSFQCNAMQWVFSSDSGVLFVRLDSTLQCGVLSSLKYHRVCTLHCMH